MNISSVSNSSISWDEYLEKLEEKKRLQSETAESSTAKVTQKVNGVDAQQVKTLQQATTVSAKDFIA
jgi:hypothetical protein